MSYYSIIDDEWTWRNLQYFLLIAKSYSHHVQIIQAPPWLLSQLVIITLCKADLSRRLSFWRKITTFANCFIHYAVYRNIFLGYELLVVYFVRLLADHPNVFDDRAPHIRLLRFLKRKEKKKSISTTDRQPDRATHIFQSQLDKFHICNNLTPQMEFEPTTGGGIYLKADAVTTWPPQRSFPQTRWYKIVRHVVSANRLQVMLDLA